MYNKHPEGTQMTYQISPRSKAVLEIFNKNVSLQKTIFQQIWEYPELYVYCIL